MALHIAKRPAGHWNKCRGWRRRLHDRDGFAMVMVLLGVSLLSIIGALSLMVAASSMQSIVNMKPEDRAFAIAEDGIAQAHARICSNQVIASPDTFSGTSQGGNYTVTVTGSTPSFQVISSATYENGGTTYRRKIAEDVNYYGDQAFDAMRNYIFFAAHDLNITTNDFVGALNGIDVNGNIRAQNMTNIYFQPHVGLGNGLTINGRVEGQNGVYLDSECTLALLSQLTINGDVLSNGPVTLRANGRILAILMLNGWLEVTGDVRGSSIIKQPLGYSGAISIDGEQQQGWSDLPKVYVPHPNMAYYKAVAQQQGNYFEGNQNFNDKRLSDFQLSLSSGTVIYVAGNLNLNGFVWDQPSARGTFVCEGDFNATSDMQFLYSSSTFQVIAQGNAAFSNNWHFLAGSERQFFIWAGNDAAINMGMFSLLNWQPTAVQITAMHDINLNAGGMVSAAKYCRLTYRPPDVDLAGFPIDVVVSNWRELPSE